LDKVEELETWLADKPVSSETAIPIALFLIYDQLQILNSSIDQLNSEVLELNEKLDEAEVPEETEENG